MSEKGVERRRLPKRRVRMCEQLKFSQWPASTSVCSMHYVYHFFYLIRVHEDVQPDAGVKSASCLHSFQLL
eukprot:COSAG02_NODE_4098_length_5781_cov_13.744984_4_plen_71_part_00